MNYFLAALGAFVGWLMILLTKLKREEAKLTKVEQEQKDAQLEIEIKALPDSELDRRLAEDLNRKREE